VLQKIGGDQAGDRIRGIGLCCHRLPSGKSISRFLAFIYREGGFLGGGGGGGRGRGRGQFRPCTIFAKIAWGGLGVAFQAP
jgi:hypothetical protein